MSPPLRQNGIALGQRYSLAPTCFLCLATCLATLLMLGLGCDSSNSNPQQVATSLEDPVGEFEWGMTRLKRALRLFRPSGADGLMTKRNMEYELIPPDDKNQSYTARVTVVSETSYLHAKRIVKKNVKSAASDAESKTDDPQSDNPDEFSKYLEIPGTGPQAPAVTATKIESRSLDNTSVFELIYTEGHWQLAQTPEKKHEQLWFEYAFD